MYDSQKPIDINCAKIVDWLVQRRHCNRDWGEKLAVIRRKIRSALGDMPENEQIKELLTNSKIDYFKCKKIVEILKETEANSKNIFGYYSSQRMKDWQDIVYQYEKNCIYLAEIATTLIREVSYEVPGIKRLINKLNKDKEDAEKERSNALKRAQLFLSEFNRLAQSYGIKGENIGNELRQESKNIIAVIDEIVQKSKALLEPLDYYREIASTTSKLDSSKFLNILHHIIVKGNTTVFELRYGDTPELIEQAVELQATESSEIDLGEEEIDFGEDLTSSESSSGFVHVDKASGNGVESQSADDDFIKLKSGEKVARNEELKSILEFLKSRNQFINNLHELMAFFNQLALGDHSSGGNVTSDANQLERYNSDEIQTILANIRQILSTINKDRNKILFQINESPIFVDDIIDKFLKIQKQATSSQLKADQILEQVKDIEKQIRETEVHLKLSTNNAKESQEKVELSLRELYNGRPINIMGCVYYK